VTGNCEDLITSVLKWWHEHQYDVYYVEDEEYNTYDEDPEFVKIAQKLMNKKRGD
jgi:hypothetical protein